MTYLEVEINKDLQPSVFSENLVVIVTIAALFFLGMTGIGAWYYLELTSSTKEIRKFETKVNGLVKEVEKKSTTNIVENNNEQKSETKEFLDAESNPFQSRLKKIVSSPENAKNSRGSNNQGKEGVKKRLANKLKVLGLLGGPDKRLAIIEIGSDVKIVKPGDRISSLTIKDINNKRVVIEEYGKELTYTFGGGED